MKNQEDCSSKPDFLRVPSRARPLSAQQHTESNMMNEFDSKLMSSKALSRYLLSTGSNSRLEVRTCPAKAQKKKTHFYNSLNTESRSLNTEVPRIFAETIF